MQIGEAERPAFLGDQGLSFAEAARCLGRGFCQQCFARLLSPRVR